MKIELGFPVEYDVQLLGELPAKNGVDHEFSRRGKIIDGGMMIAVVTGAGRWAGLVASAPESLPAAEFGIYATPSPNVVAVVARGDAYFIDTKAPERWWALEDSPIVAVRSAAEHGLLVLATPWRVLAVGTDGVAWRTPRLSIDGISLREPADGALRGTADPQDEAVDFEIDLRTGHHRGGFVFPADG